MLDRIDKDGDRFDRSLETIQELGAAATKAERLMDSLEGILGRDFSFGSVVDRIFSRTGMLIIIFFATMATAGVLYKVGVQRWASGQGKEI